MIRFATYLSPILYETYVYIAMYVGEQLGEPTLLSVGRSFEELATGQVDIAFMCGLPYDRMAMEASCPVELLVAPVVVGERYQGRPIYFSDVIVRQESPFVSFDDLYGCVWAYNERISHSGCNVVCYSLLERGKPHAYFGRTIKSGSHMRSLRMVLEGEADATALDSHVLDVVRSRDAELAGRLRVVDMLGPSSIPPVVIAKTVDDELKCRVRSILLAMHRDPCAASKLREGLIERFVAVADERYRDIRAMLGRVQAAEFPFV